MLTRLTALNQNLMKNSCPVLCPSSRLRQSCIEEQRWAGPHSGALATALLSAAHFLPLGLVTSSRRKGLARSVILIGLAFFPLSMEGGE